MNLIASVFFGQKNKFGIELEVYDALKRIGKARLWIKEKAIGEYKIRHKISYLKKGFKELFQNENELWNERFEGKESKRDRNFMLDGRQRFDFNV